MMVCLENPEGSTVKILELMKRLSELAEYKRILFF